MSRGRHRARRPRAEYVPLRTLLRPAPGPVIPQQPHHCPECRHTAAATPHRDGSMTCGECSHTSHPPEV